MWNYALPCPLNNKGRRVAMMPKDDEKSFSALSFSTSSTRKRRPKNRIKIRNDDSNDNVGINAKLTNIVELLESNKRQLSAVREPSSSASTMSDLNALYDRHVSHMSFLKENDALTKEKKHKERERISKRKKREEGRNKIW